jgi:carbon monoxide dehydrogenase subunit G
VLIKILVAVAIIVVVLVAVVVMQPSEFRVERSAVIPAPPAAVFAQINDLRRWEAWSPWEKVDPALKKTYDGPPAGVGASFAWAGNYEVGEGRVTITESRAPERVGIRLEMIEPMAATNAVTFTLAPEGAQTRVTWSMVGRNGFVSKAVGLVMDMDKMVGGQFEKGLANLKVAAARPS